jgi:hypothetical protein
MTYCIRGLDPAAIDPASLADAIRIVATAKPGFPCRVTLADAEPGEPMLLFNHVSHDAATPFRASYAVFVRAGAGDPPVYRDEPPPFLAHRTLGLRGFDAAGMLHDAALALPGEADAALRRLFADPRIVSVHIHHAAEGCFLARADREG